MKLRKFAAAAALAGAFAIATIGSVSAQSAAAGAGGSAGQNSPIGAPPQPQVPQPADQSGVNWKGVGVGAGTVFGNIFYMPAKLVYGILGGIAGGAGWALTGGNTQVANTIWRSSLGGDYVLTPSMVAGEQPVHFSGPTTTAPAPADTSAANGATVTASTNAASTDGSAGSRMNAAGPHPIDNGAGLVGAGGANQAPKSAPPTLPDTNIE